MTSREKFGLVTLKYSWDIILTNLSETGILATPRIAKIIFPTFPISVMYLWRHRANSTTSLYSWRQALSLVAPSSD